MEKLLSEKRIIVTGAGKGLGLAIAGALAVDGAHLLLVGRNQEALDAAGARMRELGAVCGTLACDLTEPGSADRVVEAALNDLGGLDGLVNNAGIFVWKKFTDLSREDYENTIATNLSVPFHLGQAAARAMIQQGSGGTIINISSIHGKTPDPNVIPHCASKAGLIALTSSMAEALREHAIRVNAVCPGAIEPDSGDRRSSSPLEKVTQSDVATMVAFLASPLASAITGAALDVNGSTRTVIKA